MFGKFHHAQLEVPGFGKEKASQSILDRSDI
jgi:hypothetical protein